MSADIEAPEVITHVMVDIETLDTEETAVILSIGACLIPRTSCQFYVECNPGTGQMARTTSQSTVDWWNQQVPGLLPNGHELLIDSLIMFSRWLKQLPGKPVLWAKGIDFDTKVLANAYKQFNLPVPWKYNDVRDFRTMKKMLPLEGLVNSNPHNALADAKHQADVLEDIVRHWKLELR